MKSYGYGVGFMKNLKIATFGLSLLVLLFCVAACDKVVNKEVNAIGGEYAGTVSCTSPGYCMDCGISFDGKMDCLLRFKPNCSGRKDAILQDFLVKKTYESGDIVETKITNVVRTAGSCI